MRTTLDIDTDVLEAARARARREGKTMGQLVSELLRRMMTRPPASEAGGVSEPAACYGFEPFASRGVVVTEELVARLRDDEGI